MWKLAQGIVGPALKAMLLGVLCYLNFRPPGQGVMLWWILFVLVMIYMDQKN